eukprot:1490269-Amphidinium_carterae.2
MRDPCGRKDPCGQEDAKAHRRRAARTRIVITAITITISFRSRYTLAFTALRCFDKLCVEEDAGYYCQEHRFAAPFDELMSGMATKWSSL